MVSCHQQSWRDPGGNAQKFFERVEGRANELGFDVAQPNCYYVWNDATTEENFRGRIDLYRLHRCEHVMFFMDGQAFLHRYAHCRAL
ncbi:hypothetical protein AAVH_09629 [Aphelenchoides avenae]|nr:hypothetical protein AAVH_09629 [Aphelenchus avenae]